MILSILICTLTKRKEMLQRMLANLHVQRFKCNASEVVEILFLEDQGQMPTGTKRNHLLEQATGKWICFVDEDDELYPYYIEEILKGCESDCDCFSMRGIMTTDGKDKKEWIIAKDLMYRAAFDKNGVEYYERYTNHLSPVKREIALQIKFPDKYIGEDYDYATRLNKSGLLKTEYVIEKPMYWYKFLTNKP